jgi:cell wall-associated NlpC family hydrolase
MAPLLFVFGVFLVLTGFSKMSKAQPSSIPPYVTDKRRKFIDAARSHIGTLYQWGGGHSPNTWGLDCSGLVIQSLKDIGEHLPPGMSTSNGWYQSLPKVSESEALPGDLAFYGQPGKATHVVILDYNGAVITSNGDKPATTPEIAKSHGWMVTTAPTYKFRKDFLGFGRMPFEARGTMPGKLAVDENES